MNLKNLKNFASFLILIISVSEINARATYINQHNRLLSHRNTKDANKENDESTAVGYHKDNEKKSIFVIASTALILTMMSASLTVEIVATLSNCEDLAGFEDLKSKTTEYTTKLQELQDISDNINDVWLVTDNLAQYINQTSDNIENLWIRMQGLNDQSAKIISALDSEVYTETVTITSTIAAQLVALNQTIDNFDDVAFKYDTPFDNLQDDLWRIHSFVTMPASALIKFMFKAAYRKLLVIENVGTNSKLLNGAITAKNWFHDLSVVKKFTAWKVANPKAFAAIKYTALTVYTLAMIGIEAYNIYMTVQRCKDLRTEVVKYIADVDEALVDAKALQVTVTEVYSNYTTYYDLVKQQMYSDAFKNFLTEIIEYADASANQTNDLTTHKATIQNFLDTIETADHDNTLTLQLALDTAFQKIGVTFQCYESKYNLLNFVVSECQSGSSYTLTELYDSKYDEMTSLCSSSGYVTQADIVSMATINLVAYNYSSECGINSETTHTTICTKRTNGDSVATIATATGYSVTAVQAVYDKCEAGTLSDTQKTDICDKKKIKKTLTDVLTDYSLYSSSQVASTFTACAYPDLETTDKSSICAEKGLLTPLAEVLQSSNFNLFDPAEVTTEYNSCAAITDAVGATICFYKTYETIFTTALTDLKTSYGSTAVEEYFTSSCASKDELIGMEHREGMRDIVRDHLHKFIEQHRDTPSHHHVIAHYQRREEEHAHTNGEMTKNHRREILDDILDDLFKGKVAGSKMI